MQLALDLFDSATSAAKDIQKEILAAVAHLEPEEALLQLRLDLEEVLAEDHALPAAAQTILFLPMEKLPTAEGRLQYMTRLCSNYIAAREAGLAEPHITAA